MKSNRVIWILLFIIGVFPLHAQTKLSKEEVKIKLDELNAACEAARERKLAPLREKYIEECISNKRNDPDYCRRFYADYGDRAGTRPPLFRDLPECVEAFKFQKSHRIR